MSGLHQVDLLKIRDELNCLAIILRSDREQNSVAWSEMIVSGQQRLLAMIPDPVSLADCGIMARGHLKRAIETMAVLDVDNFDGNEFAKALNEIAEMLLIDASRESSTEVDAKQQLEMQREWDHAWTERLNGNPEPSRLWHERWMRNSDEAGTKTVETVDPGNGKPTTPEVTVNEHSDDPLSSIAPRFASALASYEYALHQGALDAPTDREVFDYLKEWGGPDGYVLPVEFTTWQNYVSKARNLLERSKTTSRAIGKTRSILSRSEH